MCFIESLQTTEDIIIGGDFNARTSNKQEIVQDLNPNLFHRRASMDKETSARGNLLLGLLDLNSFVICNGRTSSDTSGAPTFINRNGSSVVDYIITDPKTAIKIVDFKVETTAASDHQPITVTLPPLSAQPASVNTTPTNKRTFIKWIPEKAADFKAEMHKIAIPAKDSSVELQYMALVQAIENSASKAGLLYTTRKKFVTNQPYFDKDCVTLKRKLNICLRTCKKFGFHDPQLASFISNKAKFKALIKAKKERYYQGIGDKIAINANPSDFGRQLNCSTKKPVLPVRSKRKSGRSFMTLSYHHVKQIIQCSLVSLIQF